MTNIENEQENKRKETLPSQSNKTTDTFPSQSVAVILFISLICFFCQFCVGLFFHIFFIS